MIEIALSDFSSTLDIVFNKREKKEIIDFIAPFVSKENIIPTERELFYDKTYIIRDSGSLNVFVNQSGELVIENCRVQENGYPFKDRYTVNWSYYLVSDDFVCEHPEDGRRRGEIYFDADIFSPPKNSKIWVCVTAEVDEHDEFNPIPSYCYWSYFEPNRKLIHPYQS